jgi:hypothetical protein
MKKNQKRKERNNNKKNEIINCGTKEYKDLSKEKEEKK